MMRNYIYQTIHTLSHHPLHVGAHCRILEQLSLSLYFKPLRLDEQRIHRDIVALLKDRNVTRELSVFVELRVDVERQIEIVISEVSLYDGYAFRSITPSSQIVIFDSPFGLAPTSARREALAFAGDLARNGGGEVALECSRNGVIYSGGGSAIFGVKESTLICSTAIECVERELTITAAREVGLSIVERDILRSDLIHLDELMLCDHRGITSISRFEEHPYMSIKAEKIAREMAQPW